MSNGVSESLFCGENLGFVMNTLCAFSVEFEFFREIGQQWSTGITHSIVSSQTVFFLLVYVTMFGQSNVRFFRCLELNFERNQGQEWIFFFA